MNHIPECVAVLVKFDDGKCKKQVHFIKSKFGNYLVLGYLGDDFINSIVNDYKARRIVTDLYSRGWVVAEKTKPISRRKIKKKIKRLDISYYDSYIHSIQ